MSLASIDALQSIASEEKPSQPKAEVQKLSPPQGQVTTSRLVLKKPLCPEEEFLLLPLNGIRFVMNELLDAVRNMDPSVDWKWENLNIWYDEYFKAFVQYHYDTEDDIYFPWRYFPFTSKGHMSVDFKESHASLMPVLDEVKELIRAGMQASPSQKSCIQTHLCQVVEEMVEKMQDHLAEWEEIISRLIKKVGLAEQKTMMTKIIQTSDFNSKKVAVPTMVHALECCLGQEKAASLVQNLPLQDRLLYNFSWASDFQSRHRGLIRSVHRDENRNPEATFSLMACATTFHQSKRSHGKQLFRQKTHSI